MSIRILGGVAKGHSLTVPKGDIIRPTSVMLKRRVFDYYQNMEGIIFIDACAGSGAMGIEAWSRGAESVYLIEKNRKVFSILKNNCHTISERHKDEVETRPITPILADFDRWLTCLEKIVGENSDVVIFFDPPYKQKSLYLDTALKKIIEQGPFAGELWVESDGLKGIELSFWHEYVGPQEMRSYHQGDSYICIMKLPLN